MSPINNNNMFSKRLPGISLAQPAGNSQPITGGQGVQPAASQSVNLGTGTSGVQGTNGSFAGMGGKLDAINGELSPKIGAEGMSANGAVLGRKLNIMG